MTKSLEIVSREEVASDVVALGFHIPQALADTYRHIPGQFVLLQTDWVGETITRSYSVVSRPNDDILTIGVKRLSDGIVSNRLCDTAKIGDKLFVSQPRGLFRNHSGRHHVYFAAGSGITPIFSMINAILSERADETVTLFFGNKESVDIIFLEDLQNLKDKYIERFNLSFLFSKQKRDLHQFNGRLDARKIKKFFDLGLIPQGEGARYYICGPGLMTGTITKALTKQGVSDAVIFSEEFIAQHQPMAAQKHHPNQKKTAHNEKGLIVGVSINGIAEEVRLTKKHPELLDAARAGGVNLPFSCRGGMCGTCRCLVTQGKTDMASNYALEDWEIEQGYVLGCQISLSSIKRRSGRLNVEFDTS